MAIARLVSALMRWITNCDIHHGADLGPGVIFPHGTGVIVGEGVVISARCSLFQFTSIGSLERKGGVPTLKEGVNVYPNTVLAGHITIGEYCRIGPHVYLTESVPSHTRISPAKPHFSQKDSHVQI